MTPLQQLLALGSLVSGFCGRAEVLAEMIGQAAPETPGVARLKEVLAKFEADFQAIQAATSATGRDESQDRIPVKEVAKRLGKCTNTIYTLAKSGELGHLRVGRGYRFRPSDIAAYEAANSSN